MLLILHTLSLSFRFVKPKSNNSLPFYKFQVGMMTNCTIATSATRVTRTRAVWTVTRETSASVYLRNTNAKSATGLLHRNPTVTVTFEPSIVDTKTLHRSFIRKTENKKTGSEKTRKNRNT